MSVWVLLRGLTRERRHWGRFPEIFRERLPDAEIVALDIPGNGALHALESPDTVEDIAAYCRAELARRGIAPPYHVLAMSLGAMAAAAWAARHAEELRACVLINTSLRPFNPFYQRLRPQNYSALLRLAAIQADPTDFEKTILRLTSRVADAKVLEDWRAYRVEYPVSRRNALRQLLAAARYRGPVVKPATRMLLLASTQDGLVDVRCSRRIAAAWGADLIEHPGAGHDLPLDDGEWVATQVGDWLRGTAASEASRSDR